MQNQLIPTFNGTLSGEIQPLVNARDLHAIMDVGKDFSTWIKDRIETYGFIEGVEFSPSEGKTSGLFGGRPKIEYHLTLDMAKELALLEVNAKGQKVRRYFIEMEKLARQEIPAYLRRGDVRPGQVEAIQLERLKQELFIANPVYDKLARCHVAGLTNAEAGKVVSKSADAVSKIYRKMAHLGLVTRDPKALAHCTRMREARQGSLSLEGGAA